MKYSGKIPGILIVLIFISLKSFNAEQAKETESLKSQFTSATVKIDGFAEEAWKNVKQSNIGISMTGNLSAPASDCMTFGNVRSLWDGALLYLLIDVSDADVTNAGKRPVDKDGVEVYFDLWNDKVPKNEEDDGITRISSQGELTGSGAFTERLNAYAAALKYDNNKKVTGYCVELAINIGGIKMENGSAIGIDFCINDAVSPSNTCRYRIFWNNGKNRGLDDNSLWGEVALAGYDAKKHKVTDKFVLNSNIKKAKTLPGEYGLANQNLTKLWQNQKLQFHLLHRKKLMPQTQILTLP